MSAFTYSALDNRGKTQSGVLEADSVRHVRELIRHKGWVPLDVEASNRSESDQSGFSFGFHRKINAPELSLVTRQLATLLQSGMPLADSLSTIASQSEKQSTRLIVLAIRSRVLEGHSLADALREHRHSFPGTFSEMVAAGEHSGHLDEVLQQLADHLENNSDSQQQVKLALIYPFMLLLVSLLMVFGLLTYVVPQVVGVFSDQNTSLPPLTSALITISEFLQSYSLVLFLVGVAATIWIRYLLSQEKHRLKFDRWLLNSWLCKRLSRATCTAQFSSTLSILIQSGIPLVEAMKIARQAMSNLWLQKGLSEAVTKLEEGSTLSDALRQCGQFSPMLLHMVASGEATGELGLTLGKASEHEQRNLNYQVNRGLKLLEPAILLFIGVVIFVIVLAILQPIFELNQLI